MLLWLGISTEVHYRRRSSGKGIQWWLRKPLQQQPLLPCLHLSQDKEKSPAIAAAPALNKREGQPVPRRGKREGCFPVSEWMSADAEWQQRQMLRMAGSSPVLGSEAEDGTAGLWQNTFYGSVSAGMHPAPGSDSRTYSGSPCDSVVFISALSEILKAEFTVSHPEININRLDSSGLHFEKTLVIAQKHMHATEHTHTVKWLCYFR